MQQPDYATKFRALDKQICIVREHVNALTSLHTRTAQQESVLADGRRTLQELEADLAAFSTPEPVHAGNSATQSDPPPPPPPASPSGEAAPARAIPAQIEAEQRMRRHVVLDTDIGTDVDDAIALTFLLGLCKTDPNISLEGITTCYNPPTARHCRKLVTETLLRLAQFNHVKVYSGAPGVQALAPGRTLFWKGWEGEFLSSVEVEKAQNAGAAAVDEAVDFLVNRCTALNSNLEMLCIGPLTNIARAFLTGRFRPLRIFFQGGLENDLGHNLDSDQFAANTVFDCAAALHIPVIMIGSGLTRQSNSGNFCGALQRMADCLYKKLLQDSIQRYLIATNQTTKPLGDPLTVYLWYKHEQDAGFGSDTYNLPRINIPVSFSTRLRGRTDVWLPANACSPHLVTRFQANPSSPNPFDAPKNAFDACLNSTTESFMAHLKEQQKAIFVSGRNAENAQLLQTIMNDIKEKRAIFVHGGGPLGLALAILAAQANVPTIRVAPKDHTDWFRTRPDTEDAARNTTYVQIGIDWTATRNTVLPCMDYIIAVNPISREEYEIAQSHDVRVEMK